MTERSYLSIGDVLALLREEFPDITISKIRFLESRGLLVPERTPSGYRKFYDHDVERLRWILRQQREHFLPLKVIKGRLEGAQGSSEPESLFDPAEAPPAEVVGEAFALAAAPARTNGVAHANGDGAHDHGSAVRSGAVALAEEHSAPAAVGRPAAAAVAVPPSRPEPPVTAQVRPPVTPPRAEVPVAPAPSLSATGPGAPPPARPSTPPSPPQVPAAAAASRATASDAPVRPAAAVASSLATGASMTAPELAQASGLSVAEIEQLESYGLIESRQVAGVACYDEEALVVAGLAAGFARFGVEARHLRLFKHAAERQAGLYSQVVMPLLRQRNPEARTKALADLHQLAELGSSLQACFARGLLRDLTGG